MVEKADVGLERKFSFLKGGDPDTGTVLWSDGVDVVRKRLADAMNAKNVAFLLGAGCSSSWSGGQEVGIPTMAPLAKEFTRTHDLDDAVFPTAAERKDLETIYGIKLNDAEYARNLERLMELLFSMRFVLRRSSHDNVVDGRKLVESIIDKVRGFLWDKCTNGKFAHGDATVLKLYETF